MHLHLRNLKDAVIYTVLRNRKDRKIKNLRKVLEEVINKKKDEKRRKKAK